MRRAPTQAQRASAGHGNTNCPPPAAALAPAGQPPHPAPPHLRGPGAEPVQVNRQPPLRLEQLGARLQRPPGGRPLPTLRYAAQQLLPALPVLCPPVQHGVKQDGKADLVGGPALCIQRGRGVWAPGVVEVRWRQADRASWCQQGQRRGQLGWGGGTARHAGMPSMPSHQGGCNQWRQGRQRSCLVCTHQTASG